MHPYNQPDSDIEETPISIRVRCTTCGKEEDERIPRESLATYTPNADGRTYTTPLGECADCLDPSNAEWRHDESMRRILFVSVVLVTLLAFGSAAWERAVPPGIVLLAIALACCLGLLWMRRRWRALREDHGARAAQASQIRQKQHE